MCQMAGIKAKSSLNKNLCCIYVCVNELVINVNTKIKFRLDNNKYKYK